MATEKDRRKEPGFGRAGGLAAKKARDSGKHALCGAKKRSDGKPCRRFAGEGTDHVGIGRCRLHGGSTPTHRTGAVKVEATRRAIEFGEPIDISPAEALLSTVRLSAGHLQFIHDELDALGNGGKLSAKLKFEKETLLRMWNDERDRLNRHAKAAHEAGVEEHVVRLVEQQGVAIARAMHAMLADPELGLTAAQQKLLPTLIRRHLAALQRPALAA
jgi:hypothetical protein